MALHIPGAYNLSLHLPVIIGTVPYRRAHPYSFTQSHFYRETHAQFVDVSFLPLPPPYRETLTPPPPFEGEIILHLMLLSHLWDVALYNIFIDFVFDYFSNSKCLLKTNCGELSNSNYSAFICMLVQFCFRFLFCGFNFLISHQ